MSEPYIGEIRLFGCNFAPRGWAKCQGQILSIAQNTALFSLLGTTYGGNGQTTFALPNMMSRIAVHHGQGSGLSPYDLGQQAGSESETLIITEMPAHSHSWTGSTSVADTNDPALGCYAVPAVHQRMRKLYGSVAGAATQQLGITGGSQPHSNLQPTLCLNYCIATEGIFPARN